MTKLKMMDVKENLEILRQKKQQGQDFLLKKQFVNNSFIQQASKETQKQLIRAKLQTQSLERTTIDQTNPLHVIRVKKPDQILHEVRQRKMEQLNQYDKNRAADKKYQDIQNLLKDMSIHVKAPKEIKIRESDQNA